MTLTTAIITASVSLVVAVVTAVVAPTISARRVRRDAINDKFDEALTALLRVSASRHSPQSIVRRYHTGTDQEHQAFNVGLAERWITHHIEETAGARAALAEIAGYVPESRDWLTSGWELNEADELSQRSIIESRRAAAIKTERLFRVRQPRP